MREQERERERDRERLEKTDVKELSASPAPQLQAAKLKRNVS
jgi:hypothetical protein